MFFGISAAFFLFAACDKSNGGDQNAPPSEGDQAEATDIKVCVWASDMLFATVTHNAQGKPISYIFYEMQENFNLKQHPQIRYTYDENGAPLQVRVTEYDAFGNITKEETYPWHY